MDKIKKLAMIFDSLANELNITASMLDKAETAYNALGAYIKASNEDWDVAIYPQGSFELGTVIKPLTEEEQYDVDLIIHVKHPSFNAEQLRNAVMELLLKHGRYEGKVENKKPCIRIQYAESSQFHMDIASAIDSFSNDESIQIARFDGISSYYYDISNPIGYIKWFKSTMQYEEFRKAQAVFEAQTVVQELKLSRIRTPLQKAVQILKRHRDIYFMNRNDSDNRPSSIIVTTLCAMAYADTFGTYEKENTYLTILNMLNRIPHYLNRNEAGEFYLVNPSNPEENFLKKWNENDALVLAFREWSAKAKMDIITNPDRFIDNDQSSLRTNLLESFGKRDMEKALDISNKQIGDLADSGKLYYAAKGGNVTLNEQEGKAYNKHTYYGEG